MNAKQTIINKSCSTCEFNFGEVCASYDSFNGYGWNIADCYIQRNCLEISFDYLIELAANLTEDEKAFYENNHKLTINDSLKRIENGKW